MKKNADATIKAKGELAEKILTGPNAAKNSAKLNQIAVLLREDDDDDVPTLLVALGKFKSPAKDDVASANFATTLSFAPTKTRSLRAKSINDVSTRIRAISAAR